MTDLPDRKLPLWMKIVILLAALPGLAFPSLIVVASDRPQLAEIMPMVKTLLTVYPFYVAATAWAAWRCWGQRPWVTWILIVVLLLTHAAMWLLVYAP